MRALEQDVTKRQASAKEMKRALPEPPPDNKSGRLSGSLGVAAAAGARTPSPASTQSTVMLGNSNAPSSTPSRPMTPWKSAVSKAAPQSSMPTIVLNDPVAERIKSGGAAQGGSTAAKIVGPQIKKAIELGGKARNIIERRIKALSANAPSTSSTAKTRELNPPSGVSLSSYGSRPRLDGRIVASGHEIADRIAIVIVAKLFAADFDRTRRRRTAANNNNGAVDISTAPAKLVSRGDEIEFGIFGMRTVIGRSQDATDKLDIDLKKIAQGGERVSRRHAEIVLRGADYFIRDLGSLNGTYIAGRGKLGRDQLYKLKDRDQVVLGGAILQFRRG